MKITEFRIKNYINHPDLGDGYIEEIPLREGYYLINMRLFEPVEEDCATTYSIEVGISEFEPIPLTEDLSLIHI